MRGWRRRCRSGSREELGKIQVKLNERKSRLVDTRKGESFGFLGFDFRRQKGRSGKWWVKYTPKMKKRRELTRKLKDIFKRFRSQPISRVIHLINPVLRGWVNYFAWGHSSTCFRHLRSWVEKKVRRHLMGARGRRGFGWKRWSSRWIYDVLGLFDAYRVKWNRPLAKARPT